MKHSLPNDVIVVAGKGHEQYQEVAGKIKFSDIKTINELVDNEFKPINKSLRIRKFITTEY